MVGGDLETAGSFIVFVRVHPVVKAGPLRVARVEFFVGQFACVRTLPSLGSEAFQHARPSTPGILVAIVMQAGEGVGDGAPCAEEVGFWELFELRGECEAKLAARAAQRGRNDDGGAPVFSSPGSAAFARREIHPAIRSATICAICRASSGGTALPTCCIARCVVPRIGSCRGTSAAVRLRAR